MTRKDQSRNRMARLKRLKSIKAPSWLIKWEQMAMALNRKGFKVAGLGKTPSQRQNYLFEKHVKPLMAQDEQ